METTDGLATGTLVSDGCVHKMPVLTLWDGEQAHTNQSTRNFSHWEKGDRIWVAWGEALIEAKNLTIIPFPARWEGEYWPDKDELERTRGIVRFLPGMNEESGWVPCDEEGRVLIDPRILCDDDDEDTTGPRETRLEPGAVVHVNVREDGCAGQMDHLGRVVFRMDNTKHKLSQNKVIIAAIEPGDSIRVQQGEQTLEGRVVTVRRRWPHYLIQTSPAEGGEMQVFAHFQQQLGSRSGWQVCEDTRLHMST